MTEQVSLTPAEMRTSAESLRALLEEIDAKTLKASGRERAFIAGALRAVELMLDGDVPSDTGSDSDGGD